MAASSARPSPMHSRSGSVLNFGATPSTNGMPPSSSSSLSSASLLRAVPVAVGGGIAGLTPYHPRTPRATTASSGMTTISSNNETKHGVGVGGGTSSTVRFTGPPLASPPASSSIRILSPRSVPPAYSPFEAAPIGPGLRMSMASDAASIRSPTNVHNGMNLVHANDISNGELDAPSMTPSSSATAAARDSAANLAMAMIAREKQGIANQQRERLHAEHDRIDRMAVSLCSSKDDYCFGLSSSAIVAT
jgi:hypothetical protein